MSWFGWLTKPHILMTGLDIVAAYLELFAVLIFGAVVFAVWDTRRVNRIKKSHGPNCTCWTCMGVSR